MSKPKLKYAVIILNYNTAEDAIKAAKSVIDNAVRTDYIVCFVDGGSTKPDQIKMFESQGLKNVCAFNLKENVGYARGNNAGIKYLDSIYDIDYVVIMNPDVQITQIGLIESLIDNISECDINVCGTQPLVWTPRIGNVSKYQTNIRKVASYIDCLCNCFYPLRLIFNKKYKDYIYYYQRPYEEQISFEVPSGSFFIISKKIFEDVKLFDERTFLYNEEVILGYKLSAAGYKFVLNPKFEVIHECGKSIGTINNQLSKYSALQEIKSMKVYLENYLQCRTIQIAIAKILFWVNYYSKCFIYRFLKCKNLK